MATYSTGCYTKIADEGMSQKPWDSQIIKNIKAYLVICFNKRAYLIDVFTWCDYVEGLTSVTEIDCKNMCYLHIIL